LRCSGGDRILQNAIEKDSWWKLKLLSAWPTIAGTMGSKLVLERIEKGVIYAGARHPLWAQEASFYAKPLIARINEYLGEELVTELKVRGAVTTRRRTTNERSGYVSPLSAGHAPSASLDEKEREALKVVGNRKLSQHMASFYQQCKRRAEALRSS
jgi:hypothetical protein